MMDKARKAEIIEKFQTQPEDTGSSEVQIALMTERIQELTEHLQEHEKDNASRQGLLKLVGQRTSLLKYLRREDEQRYRRVISELGLRR